MKTEDIEFQINKEMVERIKELELLGLAFITTMDIMRPWVPVTMRDEIDLAVAKTRDILSKKL